MTSPPPKTCFQQHHIHQSPPKTRKSNYILIQRIHNTTTSSRTCRRHSLSCEHPLWVCPAQACPQSFSQRFSIHTTSSKLYRPSESWGYLEASLTDSLPTTIQNRSSSCTSSLGLNSIRSIRLYTPTSTRPSTQPYTTSRDHRHIQLH